MNSQALDSFKLGQEKFLKAEDRMIEDFGFGASKDANVIIQRHISKAVEIVREKLGDTGRSSMKDICTTISALSPELIALVAFQGAMDCIAQQEDLNRTYHILGNNLMQELYALKMREFDSSLADGIDTFARRRGSAKYRKQAARSLAKKKGFKFDGWSHATKSRAGMWLVEVLTYIEDVFVVVRSTDDFEVPQPYLTLTEEALTYSQDIVKRLIDSRPVPLPQLSPPPAWEGLSIDLLSGDRKYKVPLVRKAHYSLSGVYLKKALETGRLQPVLSALTRASSVPWKINERVLEVVKWAFDNGIEIEGLPLKDDIQMPGKLPVETWEAMSEDEKLLRRKELSGIAAKNRALVGERMVYDLDISIAETLVDKGNKFWTLMNMDYRGRSYAVCYFNFQRQDYVRGMFLSHRGKPIDDEGLYWLSIHLANCGDFDKCSKKSFSDRIAWVQDNHERILKAAWEPKIFGWWQEADSPFMFFAACIEYANAVTIPDYVCHLPLSFDGSCSGLQHLAAMTRCDITAPLVNLTRNDTPADVYQTVADKVRAKIEVIASQAEHPSQGVSIRALAYGVDRSLVKRNVMTWAYSSKKYGMTQQLMEDTMRPLQDQVTRKKLDGHPFQVPEDTYVPKHGNSLVTIPGRTAAKLIGPLTFDTIEETVSRPAEAMRYLQAIARALAHEGKPVVWHTPLGFPVVLHYPNHKTNFVRLWMQDRGVRFLVRAANVEEAPGIDKNAAANAVAPGFVHSYDACHLQMVINEAWGNGIDFIALVHDSFGCLPGDVVVFRQCITDTFHRLYSDNDVLEMILEETRDQIHSNHHRLPERSSVTTGSYDLNDIKGALYAFA